VWSFGQDQAKTLKKELQMLLPELRVFVDVDDLANLDDLEVQRTLGAGASSTVRLVKDKNTGETMALKELNVMCDADTMHMTMNEIQILHKAHSDHLVSFIDAFFDNGRIYLALEFCDAGSLTVLVRYRSLASI